MDYLGNRNLLNLAKTAFLASSKIPVDMVLKCYDWATQMAEEEQCIVSGFSSHLEKEVLHFLMKGSCPIILVLARQMYKQIPTKLQTLLDDNRLLIISVSKAIRQSKATAYARNKYICEMADSILFVGVTEKSSLYPLREMYKNKQSNISLEGIRPLYNGEILAEYEEVLGRSKKHFPEKPIVVTPAEMVEILKEHGLL